MSEIYQTEFLRLAARASGAGRLERPDATATAHNPMCGDRITMDLKLDGERITALGYEVRACLVCQAAASVVGATAVGRTLTEIGVERQAVEKFLKEDGEPPAGFESFRPVAKHLSRHTCVLMPFKAIAEAAEAG